MAQARPSCFSGAVHELPAFGLLAKCADLRLSAAIVQEEEKMSGLKANLFARIARADRAASAKSDSCSSECF